VSVEGRWHEPRWPAIIALLGVGGVYAALPESMAIGPRWLLPALVAVLLLVAQFTHREGFEALNRSVGHLVSAVVTAFMLFSLGLLIWNIIQHHGTPVLILRSAVLLWTTNVLVFASWYWRLDAGGPHARSARRSHTEGAFLFPQMLMDPQMRAQMGGQHWSPLFVDYLFLAFNTSTALSPTDTAVLSRWAKILMMIQASISLMTIAIVAARAVNIL
jgi:hypothetical protein